MDKQAEKLPYARKSRGRPRTGREPVISWRPSPAAAAGLDAWIAASDDPTQSRARAVRKLVGITLGD